ncbi:MAG: flagellar basal body P-ring formation chaperone FlgA [Sphingomonadaceae bacterium]
MLLLCIIFSAPCALAAPTSPEQVLAVVEAAARKQVARQAEVSGLSEPQLSISVAPGTRPLSACAQGISVEAVDTRLVARMRFAAVCGGASGWRYEFVVRATLSARVAVLAQDVPAGRPLADEDLLLERHDVPAMGDVISAPQDAIGLSGKRTLRSGEVLRMGLLSAPLLVKRGDPVRIIARREQIEVSMAGEALDSGARGALVRVRNPNGTVLRTRVTGAATVEPVDVPMSTQSPN